MNTALLGRKIFSLLCCIMPILAGVSGASAVEKNFHNSSEKCQAVILINEEFLPSLLKSIDEAQNEILISMFSFKVGEHKDNNYILKIIKEGQ